MTNREKGRLCISVLLSIAWWSFVYGITVGCIFTLAILFHEYGHYYWMGREGIKNKNMTMMPPFGAIAVSKEPWPSMGAEARIALAGPGFGLISAIFLVVSWFVYGSYSVKIAIFIVCLINLFNLCLPIAVLDGGRVIKSILFSLSTRLGIGFYYLSFLVLALFVIRSFPSIFTLLMAYIIFNILLDDYREMKYAINSGKPPVIMSRQEMIFSVGLYFLITFSLIFIMFKNNVWYKDVLTFLK